MRYRKGMKIRSLVDKPMCRIKNQICIVIKDSENQVWYKAFDDTDCYGHPDTFAIIEESNISFLDHLKYNEENYYEEKKWFS